MSARREPTVSEPRYGKISGIGYSRYICNAAHCRRSRAVSQLATTTRGADRRILTGFIFLGIARHVPRRTAKLVGFAQVPAHEER
jgi:hypothetical protein